LNLGHFEEARSAAHRAVELAPNFADAWNNLGSALVKLRRNDHALAAYDRAAELNPTSVDVHNNRGIALDALRRHAEAALAYATVRKLSPQYRGIHSSEFFALRKACLWPDRNDPEAAGSAVEQDLTDMVRKKRPVAPFVLLSITDDLALLLEAARTYGAERYPPSAKPLWQGERYDNAKTRVAYLSADFRSHATAYLMAELFERHDRERFEWWGISFGPPTKADPMRERLQQAFDHFIDVADRSDLEIAQLLRTNQIDIAIDLKGYTQDCRPGILGHRPAPVQVNYLGFPGTMGAAHIDYIVADATVIPPEHDEFYTEKVVRMPGSYQVNDSKRIIGATPSRKDLGLPESAFVFCCFNNSYKITPEFFDIWMRLLIALPASVLWLFESSAEASKNLRRQAQQRGVSPERIVFAPKLPLADHLARQRQADLFLDTLPYNAHTTTSDALWAGLPVLTCMSGAFAGRVAASLLKAVGLPELITTNVADYERRALELATNDDELKALRRKLESNRMNFPLFNVDIFRRNIEAAFATMHDRRQRGLPPVAFTPAES
jgi:predicted O-linked N-acetylglucosamine transferase (SPINDLY family)